MDKKYSHFVITRFNLRYKKWVLPDDDAHEWVKDRIKVFQKFTLPSLKMQSCKKFKWFLLFDPLIRENSYFKDFLSEIDKVDFIHPVYIDATQQDVTEITKAEMKQFISSETRQIITTRLDNDDAVDRDLFKQFRII